MDNNTSYESTSTDFFIEPFFVDGQWVWPDNVPDWAGGPEAEEDFYSALREAWMTSSDPRKRLLAAEHGGPAEWKVLVTDPDFMVRAAVAMVGNADVQRLLCRDQSSLVREYVANYATPEVLRYLASFEPDQTVLYNIVKRYDIPSQKIIVERAWGDPEFLKKIIPLLPHSQQEKLLSHNDPAVRIRVGECGDRKQARAVLNDESIPASKKIFVEDHLDELEEIAAALRPARLRERERDMETQR